MPSDSDANGIHFLRPASRQQQLPLFIFLPGMDGLGSLQLEAARSLSDRFDVRCLHIPPADQSSWTDLATTVLQLIQQEKKEKSNRSVYLCGESFGGCLALQMVRQFPSCCDRVILVNPASSFARNPVLRYGSYMTQWIPESFHAQSCQNLLPFLVAGDRLTPDLRQYILGQMQIVPQLTTLWRLSLLREFDIPSSQLQQIRQPTLVLASCRDRLLSSVAEGERLVDAIPNSRLHLLPTSGHACLIEPALKLRPILEQYQFLP